MEHDPIYTSENIIDALSCVGINVCGADLGRLGEEIFGLNLAYWMTKEQLSP